MAIQVKCPNCDESYDVAEKLAGQSVTCMKCGSSFSVPDVPVEENPGDDQGNVGSSLYGVTWFVLGIGVTIVSVVIFLLLADSVPEKASQNSEVAESSDAQSASREEPTNEWVDGLVEQLQDSQTNAESLQQLTSHLTAEEIYKHASQSVVTITALDESDREIVLSSGFLIGKELIPPGAEKITYPNPSHNGYVLTSFNAISSAVGAQVAFSDASEKNMFFTVLAEDEVADLALLFVYIPPESSGKTLELSDVHKYPVGANVYTIGNPGGALNSLSNGIINGYHETEKGVTLLQTTVAISEGSSGGPLLGEDGRVVGVVVASQVNGENINFAVPADEIRKFLAKPTKKRGMSDGRTLRDGGWGELIDMEKFRDECKQFSETCPPQIDLTLRAHELRSKGEDEEALKLLLQAAEAETTEYEYITYYLIGEAHAFRSYQTLVDLPNGPVRQVFRAYASKDKDGPKACEAFEKAVALAPSFAPSYRGLTQAYGRHQQYSVALPWADKLVELVPYCAEAYQVRARCYNGLAEYAAALKDSQRAAELSPKDPDLCFQLGDAYLNTDEFTKAVESYRRAQRLGYRGIGTWYLLYRMGLAYQNNKQYEQAIAVFEECMRTENIEEHLNRLEVEKHVIECRAQLR